MFYTESNSTPLICWEYKRLSKIHPHIQAISILSGLSSYQESCLLHKSMESSSTLLRRSAVHCYIGQFYYPLSSSYIHCLMIVHKCSTVIFQRKWISVSL